MDNPGDVKQKGHRTWLAACMATGIVMDVTLNKYSATLPLVAVFGLWLIPIVLLVIWFFRVESTNSSIKKRFLRYPWSYSLVCLILILVIWIMTTPMIAKLKSLSETPTKIQSASQPRSMPYSAPVTPPTEKPKIPHRPPLHPNTPPPVNCDNNIGNCGPNYGSQTFNDYRQFGAQQPAPSVSIEKIEDADDSQDQLVRSLVSNPGVTLTLAIDRSFVNPAFLLTCNRPCLITNAMSSGPIIEPRPLSVKDDPNETGISLGSIPLAQTDRVLLTVRSLDNKPIQVLEIRGYVEPIHP